MSAANSAAGSRAGSPTEPTAHMDNDHDEPRADAPDNDPGNMSDKDSDILSEIDEDQFEDYDPTLEERPVEIDENIAMTLKAAKRKRTDGETTKKPKEGRRPKKRVRANDDQDVELPARESRPRRARATGGERRAAANEVEEEKVNEENLTPEERRLRALQRVMDDALKNPKQRRRKKKDDIDLADKIDQEIANLKIAMENACIADNEAREKGIPATQKLMLLPQVKALLEQTAVQDSVLDPEINFLQSVKYFLEPLNDGTLPAYNIQRDIFNALAKLPINKEVLLSSGIGKVVYFYTRSKRPQASIKRIAERLVGEWSRPVLKRTDDYRKRRIEYRQFDFAAAKLAQGREAALSGSQMLVTQRPAEKTRLELERERMLAPPTKSNRAQPAALPASYTIAPLSTFRYERDARDARPIGAETMAAFRRMTQKGKGGAH